MTWSQIRCSDGINMKKIPITSLRHVLPSSVSEEEEILKCAYHKDIEYGDFKINLHSMCYGLPLNMQSVLHNE